MTKAKKKDPVSDLLANSPVQITLTLPVKQANALLLLLSGMTEDAEMLEAAEPTTPATFNPAEMAPAMPPVFTPAQMPQAEPVPVGGNWPASQLAPTPAAPAAPYANVSVFPAATPVQPAVQPAYQPQNQPGYPPTAAPQYTMDQLAQAAAPLADRGMQRELSDLLARYNARGLSEVNVMYYPSVAADLRALGAKI